MDFIYIFIGILVILPLAQYLIVVVKLLGTQLRPAKLKPIPKPKLSQATLSQFKLAIKELKALGFEFFHFHAYQDIIAANKPTVQIVMQHRKHRCYAVIANPHNPDLSRPYALKFQSFTENLTTEAMDQDAAGVVKDFDGLHAFDYESENLEDVLTEFLAVREGLVSSVEKETIWFESSTQYCQHLQKCYAQYFRYLYQNNWLRKNQDTLQFSLKGAIKLAWQMLTNRKKKPVTSVENTEKLIRKYPFLPRVQALAHRRVSGSRQASQLGRWGKTLLFFGSALAFALLFGLAWSPYLVLILIPVLLFHELGHYAAMKAFGYRDLQILFLPIGAMVSGNKKQPTAMQQTIVSLAGPVPGLLLAFALAVWAPDFIISEYGLSLVFMLLIINYLNLLPFMPLDGGHVVNQLLFDRWPFLQFGLMLSSVLIFALGAWAWSDPVLTVLAVIFGLGLKNNYQQAHYVNLARQHWGLKLKNRDNLSVVYHMMKDDPAPFDAKFQDATAINERLSHSSPSVRDSVLGMLMYLTALVAPLVVVQQVVGLDLIKFLFVSTESSVDYASDDYQQWDPEYWQQQFNQAYTATDKQQVIQQALLQYQESEDQYLLSEVYPQAIALYESSHWQDHPEYPLLLQAQLQYQLSENPEMDVQPILQNMATALGSNSLAYAEILVNVSTWQTWPGLKDQLLNRLDLLESHQKYSSLLFALTNLQLFYEEQGQWLEHERLLDRYMALFKQQAANLYPTLRQYQYQNYLAQQKYQHILDLAQQDINTHVENKLDIDTYLYDYETLSWVALLDHQYDLAVKYQQLRKETEQKQQQVMKNEMGFLAGLVISDQVSAVSLNQDPLFELALAVQKNQPEMVKKELTNYIQFIEGWRKQPFATYLQQIKHLDTNKNQYLHHIKYRFLFGAIRLYQPELLTDSSNSNQAVN